MKETWENNLKESIKLNAPKGEQEMILWFLKDIDKMGGEKLKESVKNYAYYSVKFDNL